jgi:hypothetical protein
MPREEYEDTQRHRIIVPSGKEEIRISGIEMYFTKIMK